MLLDNILKYNYSFSKDESYFNYSLYNSSIISRVVLDVSGQIKQMTWIEDTHQWKLFWSQPRTQCQVYAYCGPSRICNLDSYEYCEYLPGFEPRSPGNWELQDGSGGYVREADLQCVNGSHGDGERDQLLLVSNVRLPEYPLTLQARVPWIASQPA